MGEGSMKWRAQLAVINEAWRTQGWLMWNIPSVPRLWGKSRRPARVRNGRLAPVLGEEEKSMDWQRGHRATIIWFLNETAQVNVQLARLAILWLWNQCSYVNKKWVDLRKTRMRRRQKNLGVCGLKGEMGTVLKAASLDCKNWSKCVDAQGNESIDKVGRE